MIPASSFVAIGRRFLSVFLVLVVFARSVTAISVPFTDCLNYAPIRDAGVFFTPYHVDATYTSGVNGGNDRVLRFIVNGTMSGSLEDLNTTSLKYSTMRSQLHALQYKVYDNYSKLCDSAESCPFGPGNTSLTYFFNISDAYQGIAFNAKFIIINPADTADVLGCVQASITPVLADYVWFVLVFLIVGITLLVGATFFLSAYFNPWNSTGNLYVWSSNYGADVSFIRLITPGYFDLIKHLQFIFLLASMSLEYPGFLQPLLSTVSWTVLQFSNSLVSKSSGSLDDGLFVANATYGLERMSQINQIPRPSEIWSGFILYFICIMAAILVLCELIAVVTWGWKKYTGNDTSDLRTKSTSLLIGIFLKMSHNLFALPLITFSFFQCIITHRGPVYLTALAVLVIFGWIVIAGFTARRLIQTKPRQALFDDITLMLRYGTFYSTYAEQGVLFFTIELSATFLRGLTFGALQVSGMAQIIILAMLELFYFFCILIVKPFDGETSMNLISGLFSMLRFVLIFLTLPFLSSLHAGSVIKQWIGYAILILHGLMLLLYLMHGLQVVVEVLLRAYGDVTEEQTGAIYSLKQLSKRKRKTVLEQIALSDTKPYLSPTTTRHHGTGSMDGRMLLLSDDGRPNSLGGISPLVGTSGLSPLMVKDTSPALTSLATSGNIDSLHEDFVTSPMSRTSFFDDGHRNSVGYYRKPRRRGSSHDMGSTPPHAYSSDRDDDDDDGGDNGPDPDAIRFGLVSPPPKGVDYAVRESDVYFTKQGQHKLRKQRQRRQNRQGSSTESVPDERNIYDYGPYSSGDGGGGDPLSGRQRPYSEYEELRGSEVAGGGVLMATSKHRSRNPNSLVGLLDGDMSSNTLERNDDEYSGAGLEIAPTYGNRSTNRPRVGSAVLSWFKGKRDSLFSKGYEEPSIEPRGFEVMRRGPIRTHRGGSSTSSSSSETSPSRSLTLGEEPTHEPPYDVSNHIPATTTTSNVSNARMRVVNDDNVEARIPAEIQDSGNSNSSSNDVNSGAAVVGQTAVNNLPSRQKGPTTPTTGSKGAHRRQESYVESSAGTFVFPISPSTLPGTLTNPRGDESV